MTKHELRQKIKNLTENLSREYIKYSSEKIYSEFINSDDYKKSHTINIYISTDREVDTHLIIKKALSDGKTVLVPRCENKTEMNAVEIKSLDNLVLSKFGIYEPKKDIPAYDKSEIDLCVIPCVSASKDGKRLGHGAGYYDRFLAGLDTKLICLCFKKLMSDDIQMNDYDICMDKVISE